MDKKKIVITYGTFDIFHKGHERLLKRAKKLGDKLIVGVSSDSYNVSKGKSSIQNENDRLNYVKSLPYVDKAILENELEKQWREDVVKYNADLIVMGSDKKDELKYLENDLNIVYLERTPNISSSQIRSELKNSKVVITYGTFDLFHEGHERLLKKAKKLGDKLIVGVSSDSFNALKNKKAFQNQKERIEKLRSLDYIDSVILEETWEQKEDDIKKYCVDTLVMGDDWKGKFDNFKNITNVVYLPRTEGISSTMLRAEKNRET